MKRFRLSTLMLLVVIAALVITLSNEEIRHRRREAEQQARTAALKETYEANFMLMKLVLLR